MSALSSGTLTPAERSKRSILVGNIPHDATEEQLRLLLLEFGSIINFRFFNDSAGNQIGYAFCEYENQEMAVRAIHKLNDFQFKGQVLKVDTAASDKSKEELESFLQGGGASGANGEDSSELDKTEKAPEEISKAVASLPPEQMFELMKQMKMCIENNPHEARNLLLQNPQLAFALLQAQIIMRIVDPEVALKILNRPIPDVAPTSIPGSGETKLVQEPVSSVGIAGSTLPTFPSAMPGGSSIPSVSMPQPSNLLGMPSMGLAPNAINDLPVANDQDIRQHFKDSDLRSMNATMVDKPLFDPRVRPGMDPRISQGQGVRMQDPRIMVGADPRTIQAMPGADPRAVSALDPRGMPILDPRVMPALDPRAIPNIDPRAMPGLDPRLLQGLDPRAMSSLDPRAMLIADPRSMPGLDARAVPGADPRTIPSNDPRAVQNPDPRLLQGSDPRLLQSADPRNIRGQEPRGTQLSDPRMVPISASDPRMMPGVDPRIISAQNAKVGLVEGKSGLVGDPRMVPVADPRMLSVDPRTRQGSDPRIKQGSDPRLVQGAEIGSLSVLDPRKPSIPDGVSVPAARLPAGTGTPVMTATSAPANTSGASSQSSDALSNLNSMPQDQEKAALIMQVLQLSDEQIAMLPSEQRQSILILKEQIARSQLA